MMSLPEPPTSELFTPFAAVSVSFPGPAITFWNVPCRSTMSPALSTDWTVWLPRLSVTFCGVWLRSMVLMPVEARAWDRGPG